MTGSGKTGLCIDLLEEAALDRVPAILIDPKGDITNLLLQFPELQPAVIEETNGPQHMQCAIRLGQQAITRTHKDFAGLFFLLSLHRSGQNPANYRYYPETVP